MLPDISHHRAGMAWVVLRWNVREGYHYVGPFPDGETAGQWAKEMLVYPEWYIHFLDPRLSLPVRAPGSMPPLRPPVPLTDDQRWFLEWGRRRRGIKPLPEWLGEANEPAENWLENQASNGAFYVLMSTAEPPHLIGPFPDHQHAYSWAVDNEERHGGTVVVTEDGNALATDADGWQLVWLDDPGRAPVLRDPADASLREIAPDIVDDDDDEDWPAW
jgi:hypothetical protein